MLNINDCKTHTEYTDENIHIDIAYHKTKVHIKAFVLPEEGAELAPLILNNHKRLKKVLDGKNNFWYVNHGMMDRGEVGPHIRRENDELTFGIGASTFQIDTRSSKDKPLRTFDISNNCKIELIENKRTTKYYSRDTCRCFRLKIIHSGKQIELFERHDSDSDINKLFEILENKKGTWLKVFDFEESKIILDKDTMIIYHKDEFSESSIELQLD